MKYYKIIILLLFGILFASCNKEEDLFEDDMVLNDTRKIILDVSVNEKARVAKQTFTIDDTIGLYLVNYVNGEPGVLGDIFHLNHINTGYVYNGTMWYNRNGDDIFLGTTPADLYAYHPYDVEMSRKSEKLDLTAYPFEVETNQDINSTRSDFLWTKVTQLSAAKPVANVVYQHLMSRIEINLSYNGEVTPTDLKIHNTKTASTINLRTGEVSPKNESGVISPAMKAEVNNGAIAYNAILIPQTIEKGTPLFSVTLNEEIFVYEAEEDIILLPRHSYVFNMTAGASTKASDNKGSQKLKVTYHEEK